MPWYVTTKTDPAEFIELDLRGKMLSVITGNSANDKKTTKVAIFSTAQEAEQDVRARAQQLTSSGYVACDTYDACQTELTKAATPWRKTWNKLLRSKRLPAAFVEHFSYLISTDEDRARLTAIVAKLRSVRIADGDLVFTFDDAKELIAAPPDPSDYPAHPDSYRALMHRHADLRFPNQDGLGLRYEDPPGAKITIDGVVDADVAWCMTDISDGWFFHPTVRNAGGEPTVCFWSHDSGEWVLRAERTIGSLFVEGVAEGVGARVGGS